MFSASQFRAVSFLLTIFLLALIVRLILNRTYVAAPTPPMGQRAGELADRVDPNTATWQLLASIPTVGESRAKEIVAYRERHASSQPAFKSIDDLTRVRGIGRVTAENLEPYLLFPAATRPATMP